jgi:hypothetical protein
MARGLCGLALCLLAGCAQSDDVNRDSCTRMRDHIVDLRVDDYSGVKDVAGRSVNMAPHHFRTVTRRSR